LDIPDGHELFTLSIPSDTVGLIIGKGGSTIRQIQDRTGALVQMQKDREAEERGAPIRTVLIAGPPNKVAAARREVENIIRVLKSSTFLSHFSRLNRNPMETLLLEAMPRKLSFRFHTMRLECSLENQGIQSKHFNFELVLEL